MNISTTNTKRSDQSNTNNKNYQEYPDIPKKKLWKSYVEGIRDESHGESYAVILRYFFPEWITALTLYSVLYLLDARWIADLKSTSIYATLGVTNTLIHFLIKIGEGFTVGSVILSGQQNGREEFEDVGRTFVDSFWITFIGGLLVSGVLFFGSYWIYYFYGVPEKMIAHGTPFLRIRAISIFFMFMYFALISFLRGIKNTRVPMKIFIAGGALYLFCDYGLIFGAFGMPHMGLNGSATASVIQYVFMVVVALGYVLFHEKNKKYGIILLNGISSKARVKRLVQLGWPIMLDKAIMAFSYVWLTHLFAPMGKYALASFTVIKDLERLAILPAAGFAQVITFLVSNSSGIYDWSGIKTNIKKCLFLSSIFVFVFLCMFSLWPKVFITLFDQKGKFTDIAAEVFPILSVLVFFDLLQLVLSGAMRGVSNVHVVMFVRLSVFLVYFMPVSWFLAQLPIENFVIKFLVVYGSFYIGNALMSVVYIWRFRGNRWKHSVTQDMV
jgi:multidrug resistance protein, MATE family